MKKIFLFLLLSYSLLCATSQDLDRVTALHLVSSNKEAIGLTTQDLNNIIVSSAYYNQISGTQLIYLQQSFKGLPVFNQIQSLAFKNGLLVSATGSRIKSMDKRSKMAAAIPFINAETAVRKAMAEKKTSSNMLLKGNVLNAGQKIDFGKLDIANEKITAELMWVPINDGSEVRLSWQVYLVPSNSSDYWLIRVDANNNQILGETNLTVYCKFDLNKNHMHESLCMDETNNKPSESSMEFSPTIVNGASYRVVAYPAESPIHPGGNPILTTNPWTMAPGDATSLKWHSDGTTDYTITRGNNVWAAEDRDGNNTTNGLPATSTTTTDPLTFDFVPNFTVAPTQTTPAENQSFNTTNLFYWNNIIHDLVYQYGFNEVAGNFQLNNLGRGGTGNDFVIADAQDGAGTNNANFSTPADGGNGRMQMYLWNGNPQKDGDADNGIIVHEFTHGISNRLTGGPAQAGCLGNDEQMGEGWSDYFALMATQNWATATVNDGFNSPRGIGTYASGQAITGSGIRPRKYTTNMGINEMTYANLPTQTIPHGVGFIWCSMLWEMTWEIIQQAGINPNLFDPTVLGGNSIALKLVTEAMKLQPCSPGFIDGRNAIIQADQLLYGGEYHCAIVAAFARRGLGFDAKQGSSTSRSDGTAGFSTIESKLTITQNITQQLEGSNITYSNRVSAGICSGLSNYLLTDTLPSNVSYVSGGIYNSTTRVVSFPVNLAAGQIQDYSFTVKINNGSWFPTVNLLDEQVSAGSIPSSWATSSINGNNFTVSSTLSYSAPNAFFGFNAVNVSDYKIATINPIPLGVNPPLFSFWHNYNTEDGWDGGLVEISINGGASWTDLGPNMTLNGYNGSMGTGSNNPLGGKAAFTGKSNGFIKTIISLSPYAGQNALFRFRVGSDDNTAVAGWYIDDILLQSKALVNMRSNLFNQVGTRVNVNDTVTIILESAVCNNGVISSQPANITSCAGSNISFTVNATGTALSYQWQESSNAGLSYNDIPGATSSTLNLTDIHSSLNGNKYRMIINGTCTLSLASDAATLTVSEPIIINTSPSGASVCTGSSINFITDASGPSLAYQWQVSNSGNPFTNISNGTTYSGANSDTLVVTGITSSLNESLYRVIVSGFACAPVTSASALLIANPLPVVLINGPERINITPAQPTTLTSTITGTGTYTYQWYRNNILLNGVNGTSYPVDVDRLGSYSIKVTDSKSCSASSNIVTVGDSASNQLFIYPNPNNGQFQVRYFSPINSMDNRTLTIYDARGSKIYVKKYPTGSTYYRMDVTLTNVPPGVYTVDLRDNKGNRLASGSLIIQ